VVEVLPREQKILVAKAVVDKATRCNSQSMRFQPKFNSLLLSIYLFKIWKVEGKVFII